MTPGMLALLASVPSVTPVQLADLVEASAAASRIIAASGGKAAVSSSPSVLRCEWGADCAPRCPDVATLRSAAAALVCCAEHAGMMSSAMRWEAIPS